MYPFLFHSTIFVMSYEVCCLLPKYLLNEICALHEWRIDLLNFCNSSYHTHSRKVCKICCLGNIISHVKPTVIKA